FFIFNIFSLFLSLIVPVTLLAPSIDITMHVEQAQVVGLLAAHRPRPLARILEVPAIFRQQLLRLAVIPAGDRTRPAGILPLCFRRQPVARQTQVILLQPGHLPGRIRLITPLVLGNALLLAQPVAVRRRFVPDHAADRTGRLRETLHLTVAEVL